MTEQPQITTAKISDLLPYANNAREHTDEQVAQVAASIQEFGWTNPLIVHGTTVVAGHARLAAARKLGMTEVPIIDRSDMSEAQWKAYVLADNQLAQNATWNEGLLSLELDYLTELDFDLDLIGFPDLDELMGDEPEEGLTDPDDVPEPPAEAITQPGDLWILGDHRLLCGDSTDAESVAYLMDGAKADMVFTDPPYGVGYTGGAKKRESLAGDEIGTSIYSDSLPHLKSAASDHAPLYLWYADAHVAAAAAAAADSGYVTSAQIIWVKNNAQFVSAAKYHGKHEPCFYAHRKGKSASWYGGNNEVTVWEVDRAHKNEYHPTQKPTELAKRAAKNSTKKGDLVLDLFLGSGATLIAAEEIGRKCYGIEIDPTYCDVIVTRWEAFTGEKAVRHGGT